MLPLICQSLLGQINQNINKTADTVKNIITEIDSIRFDSNAEKMEMILKNGNQITHTISDIINVTFSGGGIVSTPGTPVNYNDATYPTIVLGNGQEWMAENLRTSKYNDGSTIPLVTDDAQWATNQDIANSFPMMCWYDNDEATYTANKFGALYNWFAINPSTNGNKNICPAGWHVPSDADWNILIGYLDPSHDPNAIGAAQSTSAGGKMKSVGTKFWLSPNTDATNQTGFSGLPGGGRYGYGLFGDTGNYGFWWSSTERNNIESWGRYLNNSFGDVFRNFGAKRFGLSVRCLKD